MISTITIKHKDGTFVIRDHDTDVSTQDNSKIEALLMLADALSAYEASDDDHLEMATDIFVADDQEKRELLQMLVRDLESEGIYDWYANNPGWADHLPDLSEDEDDPE